MSSTQKILSIDEAIADRFASSTTDELRHYLSEGGVDWKLEEPQDALRGRCLSMVGLASSTVGGGTAKKPTTAKKGSKEDIVPPYRMEPNGIWEGRKHRVRIPRPNGTTKAKAEVYGWNGKKEYWLPFDETVSIPEPIYQIIMDRKRRIVNNVLLPGTDGERTTEFEFADFNMTYLGVDPLYADRAGSITEWYQWHKPSWFSARNTRELQRIATILDIELRKRDVNRTSKDNEELVADILTFVFGDPNAEDAN